MDDRSIEAESNIEILRAQRAAMRRGTAVVRDTIRENEGVDEEATITIDAGIRIEPFNMRREMAEGHFDEGGFYVLNKEEEKKVTDAWLDTVDQAERTASFKRDEAQRKAGATAASRISALSKHLKEGGGDDDEDEKEEEEEGADGEKKDGSAEKAPAQDKAPDATAKDEEDAEDGADEVTLLEGLIAELLPLETASDALARLAKPIRRDGPAAGGLPALKTRSRVRQARAEIAAGARKPEAAAAPVAPPQKPKKRKFDEFGYSDEPAQVAAAVAPVAAAQRSPEEAAGAGPEPQAGEAAKGAKAAAPTPGAATTPPAAALVAPGAADAAGAPEGAAGAAPGGGPAAAAGADAPDTGGAASGAGVGAGTGAGAAQQGGAAADGGKPATAGDPAAAAALAADPAAVAAWAEKAAAKEKADAEAAAAFAAEMKMTKQVLHVGLDAAGPEAAAILNLNSDDAKAARAAAAEGGEEPEERGPILQGRKRALEVDAPQLERRRRIERLTELCDALLQKGVNVYDSTRELLAIEVRVRKGEKLNSDAPEATAAPGGTGDAAAASTSGAANKQEQPASGAGKREGDAGAGGAAGSTSAPAKVEQVEAPTQVLYDNRRVSAPPGQSGVMDADQYVAPGLADQQLLWQLRWGGTPDEIHGPFDSMTMHGWMTQGCFSAERPAEIRQCDPQNEPLEKCWHRWDEVNFSLYL